MTHNLTLKKRILFGYLAPFLIIVGLAVAMYWTTQGVQRISESVEVAHGIVDEIKDLHLELNRMQSVTRGIIMKKDEGSRKFFEEKQSKFAALITNLREHIKDPRQQEKLHQISTTAERLIELMRREIDLVEAGEGQKALDLFLTGAGNLLAGELDTLTNQFEQREAEILTVRSRQESEAMEQMLPMVIGASLTAILLAVVLGLWIATRISRTIVQSLAVMGSSSSEIAATVEQHEHTVSQQTAAMFEVTTTVEELGASAVQSARQAESAASAAQQALTQTQDGVQLANRAMVSMDGMKQRIESVAGQILRLSEQAGQIGDIAEVVGKLAGETNMLALNAAVEAARAGEQGKGFAVVAIEVRKLADQSKKSAERANALVGDIRKATHLAVKVTEEGSRSAEEVSAIVQSVAQAFTSIAGAADRVSENAQQVTLTSKQQSTALGQVSEAMRSLAEGSRQIAAGAEQTKIGIRDLNQVALGLKAMV